MKNKRKYPDKFVVECADYNLRWDVTYDGQEGGYHWVNSADGGSIGHFSAESMDAHNRDQYKFIFPEPELVFPFKVRHKNHSSDESYLITQGTEGQVDITHEGQTWRDYWTTGECKDFIKSGTWFVQSVGDKPVGQQTLVEAPTSDVEEVVIGKLILDSKEALGSIRELTEAVDTLTDSFANLKVVMERFRCV